MEQTASPEMSSGVPNEKVKTPSSAVKAEDVTNATVPGTPNKLQTPKQMTPNKSPPSRSPMSPRRSPKVSPRTPV